MPNIAKYCPILPKFSDIAQYCPVLFTIAQMPNIGQYCSILPKFSYIAQVFLYCLLLLK